jgi:hypothetical protein
MRARVVRSDLLFGSTKRDCDADDADKPDDAEPSPIDAQAPAGAPKKALPGKSAEPEDFGFARKSELKLKGFSPRAPCLSVSSAS